MTGIEVVLVIAGVILLLATSLHTLGIVLLVIAGALIIVELFFAIFVFNKITRGFKDFDRF